MSPKCVKRGQLLRILDGCEPGDEGKWFAAAKELGFYDLAIALARQSPCDPKTLARAARDFAEKQPGFAQEAGFASLCWLSLGHGYEIASLDVWSAYHGTLKAAEQLGRVNEVKQRIRGRFAEARQDGFARQILGRELELP